MTAKNIVFGAALIGAVMTAGTPARGQARPEPRPNVMVPSTSLRAGGSGSQLGVTIEDTANGVRVGDVTSGSAADKAGLKEGDLVVEYDGERVRSARQLTRLVQETPEGRSVKVAIQRNGQRQTVDATPDTRAFSWNFDGDQMRREIERGMERMPREFSFRMDDRMPAGATIAGSRARLGVSVQSLSPQLAEYFGAKDGGALVSSVRKDSAADKAGIKAGDVITSIDGDHVGGADALTSEMADKNGTVSIGILRDKKPSTVKVTFEK
ncbi:MAG: PDZ domain-containing protein [Vicinamibacterales bacterium]